MNNSVIYRVNRILLLTFAAVLIFFAVSICNRECSVYASVKAPETPVISSFSTDGNTVTMKWSSAKRAKNYQVGLRSQNKSWKYLKKVKKTDANRKKYTKKNLYKVKAGTGKNKNKYLVYKYRYTYKVLAKLGRSARSYSYVAPDKCQKITLAVRGVNRDKKGSWRTKSVNVHTWEKTDNGFRCTACYATKESASGPVTPHTHKWEAREKTRTAYTSKSYWKITIKCLGCNHPSVFVEDPELDAFELDTKEHEMHVDQNKHLYDTDHGRTTLLEDKLTKKVPYEERYTEKYCTECGAKGETVVHKHSWAEGTKSKKEIRYRDRYLCRIVKKCDTCGKDYPRQYLDPNGNVQEWIPLCYKSYDDDAFNPSENWELTNVALTEYTSANYHVKFGCDNFKSWTERYEYKTVSTPYEVTYEGKYCRDCEYVDYKAVSWQQVKM